MEWHFTSHSPQETQRLGALLGSLARKGDVFLLVGQLGAGKTCLVQGIAWGLGIQEYVRSPSFVLVGQYQGRLPLYHVDLYRLERVPEIADLGLEEYFEGGRVSVVEWADRATELMPAEHLLVNLEVLSEEERRIKLTSAGERYHALVQAVADAI